MTSTLPITSAPLASDYTQDTAAGIALSELAHDLYRRGWMAGTSGNLSVRLAREDTVLITASGLGKGRLSPSDTVLVSATTGEPLVAGSARPSAETSIHIALYQAFPDCGAVVHAHTPYATALASRAARAGERWVRFTDFELIKGMGRPFVDTITIPVFPNWPEVPRIAAEVKDHYAASEGDTAPVLLIAHHGATAWGANLAEATDRLECLEALSHLALLVEDARTSNH